MEKRITVHLDNRPVYDIVLSESFSGLSKEIRRLPVQGRRVCIVTDTNVEPLYLDQVRKELTGCFSEVEVFSFPAGEMHKNLDTVRSLYEKLIVCRFDRKDWLVALGGGVVGDLCGFAAATYLRGISFIQIPTTLLSQVDSSIGGKTGVDLDSYKNMVGAFHMPKLVYTNVQTLRSLPEEQYSSGMGEILKHGLIKDAAYVSWLSNHAEAIAKRELSACMEMIRISDEIKRQVVEGDPKEHGERALLNFGHTLGHAIEKQMNFSMLHGHCVGLGCLAAARICADRGYIEEAVVTDIRRVMELFHMPTALKAFDMDAVIEDTKNDKKMDGDHIRFILLKRIGEAFIDTTVTAEEMKAGLMEIKKEF